MISPWAPGYNVVGEKLKRNTTTNQVSERSITTASASNLGDVKVKDIDGIINRGKKVGLVGIIIFWMKKYIMNLLSEVVTKICDWAKYHNNVLCIKNRTKHSSETVLTSYLSALGFLEILTLSSLMN